MAAQADRNIRLYPWFKLSQSLTFSQAIWFLYFQNILSPAEAILLYVVADLTTTLLEVPSGYASDRFGRRLTLILAGLCGAAGAALLGAGASFAIFAAGQMLLGAGMALASGTDSAFLYESLATAGRESETEAQELRAWRFSFVALAVSAVTGGAIALYWQALPFILTALSLAVSVLISAWFGEPRRSPGGARQPGETLRFVALRTALSTPLLRWFFALSVLMYVFSHVPFVFGQPFIQGALGKVGLDQNAPLISGAVTTAMMGLSVVASLFAPRLRDRMGLAAILILAFGIQIALSGVLALTNAPIVIAILLLRMVPDAFSKPFIIARIQPELSDDARATYLSLQSLCGRLLFAATLFLASGCLGQTAGMTYAEIRLILGSYVIAGLISLTALILVAARLPIERHAAGGLRRRGLPIQ